MCRNTEFLENLAKINGEKVVAVHCKCAECQGTEMGQDTVIQRLGGDQLALEEDVMEGKNYE